MSEFSLKKQRECAYTFTLVSVAVSTSAFHFDELSFSKHLDLSILRVGPDLGRVEKISVISGWENSAHEHPNGRISIFGPSPDLGAGRLRIL
jgi:hypothetical protein